MARAQTVIDRSAAVVKALKALAGQRVMVGIPAAKAARRESGPLNNAAIGYIHEHGAPEANIPPRPFLVPGVTIAGPDVAQRFKAAGIAAMDGKAAVAMKGLHAAGLIAVNAVRNKIQTGPFVPLAPTTLASRRARGRRGTKPLLDTGQLRNAITYVIRKVRP